MQLNENKIFKVIVASMSAYFLGEVEDFTYDKAMILLKGLQITTDDKEIETKMDTDYKNVFQLVETEIKEQGIEISDEFLKDLFVDFWLDLSPQYGLIEE